MVMFNENLKRDLYRDIAAKQHLALRMANSRHTFATDALETETAEDYCKRMLAKLGLKAGENPIENLTLFLTGRDNSAVHNNQQRFGMDASGTSIVDRYIRGET
jgi:hypothetical protein